MKEIWVEKYRPTTVQDCILPDGLKKTFQTWVDERFLPNTILAGSSGVGKTSVAKAALNEIRADLMEINGSLDRNIDILRYEIMEFASTVSLTDGRKYVLIDEADYLNPNSTQPALRKFMEDFSKNCGFILTANFPNKIIEPLQSRCSLVNFKIEGKEKQVLAKEFMNRLCGILDNENVTYDKKSLAGLVIKHFPDWRKIINHAQQYSVSGRIDSGVLVDLDVEVFEELIGLLKGKKFTDVRRWVGQNSDIEFSVLCRKLYDTAYDKMKKNTIPMAVLILNEHQYQAAFVVDQEINTMACLAKLMSEVEWE